MSAIETGSMEGKKRRGKASATSAESIKIRREKNREAQQVFRKRRQAAEAAQSRRTKRLEEAVEQISCVFISFFDEMLRNETIATDYPSLMTSLRQSLAQVLKLAKGVVDFDDGMLTATGVSHDNDKPTSPDEIANTTPVNEFPMVSLPRQDTTEWMPDEVIHFCVDGSAPGAISAFYNISPEADNLPGPPSLMHPDMPDWDDSAATASSASLSLQVYGNGWTASNAPPSHIEDPLKPAFPQVQRDLAALDSFPLRLLERTISLGYYTLLNDPVGGLARPGFRLSRRYRTAEQLLTSFRWLMGPGKCYAYRASGFTWGHDGGTVATLPSHMLSDPSDPLNGIPGAADANEEVIPECLTVIGVQRQLESLKARMIDYDTMEVHLERRHSAGSGQNHSDKATETPTQPLSYIDFFYMQPPAPSPQTLKLNVTQFIKNLSEIAICFSRGPGFPRQDLFNVMRASSTMA